MKTIILPTFVLYYESNIKPWINLTTLCWNYDSSWLKKTPKWFQRKYTHTRTRTHTHTHAHTHTRAHAHTHTRTHTHTHTHTCMHTHTHTCTHAHTHMHTHTRTRTHTHTHKHTHTHTHTHRHTQTHTHTYINNRFSIFLYSSKYEDNVCPESTYELYWINMNELICVYLQTRPAMNSTIDSTSRMFHRSLMYILAFLRKPEPSKSWYNCGAFQQTK